MLVLTSEQSREADRVAIEERGIPASTLMENAGRGAFEILLKYFPNIASKRVAVICGKGNNGGDGRVMARLLEGVGTQVTVVDGELGAHGHAPLHGADILIDAIFGTGLSRPVMGAEKAAIEAINRSGKWVMALDVPSGLSADKGEPMGVAVKADVTVTMGRPKIGLIQPQAMPYVGRLEVVSIGIPDDIYPQTNIQWVTAGDIRPWFSRRLSDTHKGVYGHVLVIGGSETKPGSILLTGRAALRTGSGLVTVGLPWGKSALSNPPFAKGGLGGFLELMYEPMPAIRSGTFSRKAGAKLLRLAEGREAVAIGPGLGVNADTKSVVRELLKVKSPLVIDADGLNALKLSDLKKRKAPTILTPHPGEMARLAGLSTAKIQKNRIQVAREFAQTHGVVLVLKGARTVTALPSGEIFVNSTGNAGMATAGMGDILTGVISSLMGQGQTPEKAAIAGVWIHGRAGDRVAERLGDRGLLAGDVSDEIPPATRELVE